MNKPRKICLLLFALVCMPVSGIREVSVAASDFGFPFQPALPDSRDSVIINDCFATGYYCVYNSELAGPQSVTRTISNYIYTLKASFLFGGRGVAMQGTGRTAPDGDYIKYTGGGGCFVRITGPDAGKNLEGQWIVNPEVLRGRYARLGITDFTGFGNLALLYPDRATYSESPSIIGRTGQPLTPWRSIAVDPSLIPLGQSCKLSFKNVAAKSSDAEYTTFSADDVGGAIKGKHVEIYLGEGQSAVDEWNRSGGNQYVDIYLNRDLKGIDYAGSL